MVYLLTSRVVRISATDTTPTPRSVPVENDKNWRVRIALPFEFKGLQREIDAWREKDQIHTGSIDHQELEDPFARGFRW